MIPDSDTLFKECTHRLIVAGVLNAHEESRAIFDKILAGETVISEEHRKELERAISLREKRMPIERIFGNTEFYGVLIKTDKDVFKPYPETEDLVHYAYKNLLCRKGPLRILDLGTGTGCILLALLKALPLASGVGVDINEKAIEVARENAALNGLSDRAEFRLGDWANQVDEKFDLVISNAPRVLTSNIPRLLPEMRNFDPLIAIDGGNDGMHFMRLLAANFGRIAKDGGLCMCQLGAVYASDVVRIFNDAGFYETEIGSNVISAPCCITIKNVRCEKRKWARSLWKQVLRALRLQERP